MRPQGSYKIAGRRRALDAFEDPALKSLRRVRRILDSIRAQIVEGGDPECIRLRQVFKSPREIYRLEIALPEFSYQRTTLLDRDTLEELLEEEAVRARVPLSEVSL
jgi:hypothetical protein